MLVGDSVDADTAQRLNVALWELAYTWFLDGGDDPTEVRGISVGDLAGAEAAISLLIPAVRGVLDGLAVLEQLEPRRVTLVTASSPTGNFNRIEGVQTDAFAATLSQLLGPRVEIGRAASDDVRNQALIGKYARTRDPDWLQPDSRLSGLIRRSVVGVVRAASRLRGARNRPTLAVLEYGPTRSFARRYAGMSSRHFRLARYWPAREDLVSALRAGDNIVAPPRPRAARREAFDALPRKVLDTTPRGDRFVFEGVDLWPLLGPRLAQLVERYAPFVAIQAKPYREELRRSGTRAVLVPFDTPPEARLVVRSAQHLSIPTFVTNDGFKGDDFTQEGMTADVALAWSTAIRDNYFRRRRDGTATVTGNPTADVRRSARDAVVRIPSRLLVGSFTFSPADLNCRRSDPERFLAEVLEGIRRAAIPIERIVLKLHPADSPDHYAVILSEFSALPIEVVASGDIVDLLDECDLHITTYSTTLLEAVALGVPVIYYRVNLQRLHEPFDGDAIIARRTASSPAELAGLLSKPDSEFPSKLEREAWLERYLGPGDGGSVDRIVATIERHIGGGRTT